MRSPIKPALYHDSFQQKPISLQKCISNRETISKLPSFRAIRALIASQLSCYNYLLFAQILCIAVLLLLQYK